MKNVIAVAEKGKENKKLLTIENVNKTAMTKLQKCQVQLILKVSIVGQLIILI